MQKNLDNFYEGKGNNSILITGESGIGKTVLKKELLNKNKGKYKVFESECFSIEKDFTFSPWLKIIKSLEAEFSRRDIKRPYLWNEIMKNLF